MSVAILVSGMFASPEEDFWPSLRASISPHFTRILPFPLIGCPCTPSGSTPLFAQYPLELSRLLSLCASLPPDTPITLIGHSKGGTLVLLAAPHLQSLVRVVAIAPRTVFSMEDSGVKGRFTGEQMEADSFVWGARGGVTCVVTREELLGRARVDVKAAVTRAVSIITPLSRTVRVVVVVPGADRVVPPEDGMVTGEWGCEVRLIQGAGHFFKTEAETAELVKVIEEAVR
jgi:pimeloyl-ACP methyl ester carboxylesterase